MKNWTILMAVGAAGLLCGFTEPAAATFDVWGTGDEALAYNRLQGDCDGVTHASGRNAAWGLWRAPLEGVAVEVSPAETGADLIFRCEDGGACIQAGKLEDTPDRVASHAVRFDSVDDARALQARIETLRAACARP